MTVDPVLVQRPWPFHTCPTCEGADFAAVGQPDTVVFTCLGCGTRWRYALGYLHRLEPDAETDAATDSVPVPRLL